jgi:hypothetical protein
MHHIVYFVSYLINLIYEDNSIWIPKIPECGQSGEFLVFLEAMAGHLATELPHNTRVSKNYRL